MKRKDFEWCANIGVALLIAGLVTIGLSLLMPGFIVEMMGEAELSMFVTVLTDFITKPILYSGVGVLVLAIILFVVYKILENKKIKS